MQWYFAEGNDQRGPAEEREIPDLIESGAIAPDTLVWRDGLADWEPAHQHFAHLFPNTGRPPVIGAAQAQTQAPAGPRDYRRESGMKDAFDRFFGQYATFSGRSNRGEFWFWVLDNLLITLAVGLVDSALFGTGPDGFGIFGGLWSLATLIPSFALAARRLHDIDKSGWWQLLCLVPIIGWIILLVWFCQKPDEGPNRFG